MVFPGPGAGGDDPFGRVLRDLLNVMGGSAGGGAGIDLARALAQGVATGGEVEGNVDPVERIQFEQLSHVAELHVTELTGLSVTATGTLDVATVAPGAWAWQTVEDWRFLLDAMAGPAPAPGTMGAGPAAGDAGEATPARDPGLGLADLDEDVEGDGPTADLLARWVATLGPMMAAMQLGSAVGHLSRSTLGPYELPIPRPTPRLLVVPANVLRFADEWSLPPDEVRLWVCLREITTQAVLSRPHVAARIRDLLLAVVAGMAEQAGGVMERLQELDLTRPETLQGLMGDPSSLMSIEPSSARRRVADELMAVVAALLGYVEHVLDLAAARLLGGRGQIAEAWRRRQMERAEAERAAEQMFGLDLGPGQIDRGADFVRGVHERAGDTGLARLWSDARTLPTPPEVDAPGLWLERIALDEA
ncbi:MAG: zinc-dependent metalloprotease [Acidimicrobiales bacterium]